MDDVLYCYTTIEELGISLDADARVHILDTVRSTTLTPTATFFEGGGGGGLGGIHRRNINRKF